MNDLIKSVRLDVIDDLVKEFANNGGNSYFIVDGQEYRTDTGYAMEGIELFAEKLKERVSKEIEQQEHKTGKWIVHYECPKCGEITKDFTEYCPFCNADMRGEVNG